MPISVLKFGILSTVTLKGVVCKSVPEKEDWVSVGQTTSNWARVTFVLNRVSFPRLMTRLGLVVSSNFRFWHVTCAVNPCWDIEKRTGKPGGVAHFCSSRTFTGIVLPHSVRILLFISSIKTGSIPSNARGQTNKRCGDVCNVRVELR
jgi:hypothetical protein